MEILSKGEFLSFLYAEKSRELENNSAPGWSIWAIWGIIISMILFSYDAIMDKKPDINILLLYFLYALTWILIFVQFIFTFRRRIYSSIKVRRLIEEAPVTLYTVRVILSVVGLIISIAKHLEWYSCLLWCIVSIFNIVVVGYVYLHKNKIVKAGLKTNIFTKDKYDLYCNWALIFIYSLIASFQLQIIQNDTFARTEFEITVAISCTILAICKLINISQRNKTAEGLDYIIEAFTGGFINQKEAYKRYMYLIYGKDIIQMFDNEMKSISNSNIQEKCEVIKQDLRSISHRIHLKTISINEVRLITESLSKHIIFCGNHIKTFGILIKKENNILSLGMPPIVVLELHSMISTLGNSLKIIEETQNQISQTRDSLEEYISNNLYCKKMDGLCDIKNCTHRNDPTPWYYKLKKQVCHIFPSKKTISARSPRC